MQTRNNKRHVPQPSDSPALPEKRRRVLPSSSATTSPTTARTVIKTTTATRARKPRAARPADDDEDHDYQEEEQPKSDHEESDSQEAPFVPSKIANSRKGAPLGPGAADEMASVIFPNPHDSSPEQHVDHDSEDNDRPSSSSHRDAAAQTATIRQFRALSLADLKKGSEELIQNLRNLGRGSDVFRLMVKPKRTAFLGYCEIYNASPSDPFISWEDFDFLDGMDSSGGLSPRKVFGYANLATALNIIDTLLVGASPDKSLYHLSLLDDFSSKLFVPFGEASEAVIEAILDLRTIFTLITMAHHKVPKGQAYSVIASIFCGEEHITEDANYRDLLVNGPFKPLIHGEEEDTILAEKCSQRIKEIIDSLRHIQKKKTRINSLDSFRGIEFAPPHVVDTFKTRILEVYDNSQTEECPQSLRHSRFSNSEERIREPSPGAESQPITRLEGPQIPSLFNPEAMKRLNSLTSPTSSIPPSPPSNQSAGRNIPRFFTNDHDNMSIIGPRPSSTNYAPEPSALRSTQTSRPARTSQSNNDEEDDEDDDFEQDNRPIDKNKSADISRRLQQQQQTLPQSPTIPSSSAPQPSHNNNINQSPPSSSIPPSQFDVIRENKARLNEAMRATDQQPRQRRPWSNTDSETLIRLIGERKAAWSVMDQSDKDEFEYPRDQQAYRDKARNMKVDYLLSDIVLPPSFDLVTLGKKEIDRLIKFGKNPYRKERHVDERGNPIMTEYVRTS